MGLFIVIISTDKIELLWNIINYYGIKVQEN